MKVSNYSLNIHQNIFERFKVLTFKISNNVSEIIKNIPTFGMSFKKSLGSIAAFGAAAVYTGPIALVAATTTFVAHRIITPMFKAKSKSIENPEPSNLEVSYYESLSQKQTEEAASRNYKQVVENAPKKTLDLAEKPLKLNQEQQLYAPALLSLAKQPTIFQNNALVLRNKDKKHTPERQRKNISASKISPNLEKQTTPNLGLNKKVTATLIAIAIACFTKKSSKIFELFLSKKPIDINKPITQANALTSSLSHTAFERPIELNSSPLTAQKIINSICFPTKPQIEDAKIYKAIRKILHRKTPITIATKKRTIQLLNRCHSSQFREEATKIIKAHQSNKEILLNLKTWYLKQRISEILNSDKNDREKIQKIKKEIKKQPKSDLKKETQELVSQKVSQARLIQLIKDKINLI